MRQPGPVRCAAGLVLALLGGCATSPGAAPNAAPGAAPGPPFPAHVADFEQVEPPVHGRSSVVAGYQLVLAAGSVVATVQRRAVADNRSLIPALDQGAGGADAVLAAELARSIAQVRRFYPDATASAPQSFLVLQEGRLRPGRAVVMDYRNDSEGADPAMQLDVKLLCCTAAHEMVEYRFRHPAGVTADLAESDFLRQFPWRATTTTALDSGH
jgi:hypothetical protein